MAAFPNTDICMRDLHAFARPDYESLWLVSQRLFSVWCIPLWAVIPNQCVLNAAMARTKFMESVLQTCCLDASTTIRKDVLYEICQDMTPSCMLYWYGCFHESRHSSWAFFCVWTDCHLELSHMPSVFHGIPSVRSQVGLLSILRTRTYWTAYASISPFGFKSVLRSFSQLLYCLFLSEYAGVWNEPRSIDSCLP